MTHVATLIANPRLPSITDAIRREASDWLRATRAVDLAPEIATDLFFEAGPRPVSVVEADLRKAFAGATLDLVIQPVEGRRKRLFLADMDSTMIEQECIDELADFVGLKAEVSAITERAMQGEIAFEPALRERVALLKSLPVGVVDEIVRDRLTLTPGGRELVGTMRANGGYACLVSGGFTLFTGPVAAIIGFDEHRSNVLEITEGRLAGRVAEPILGREAKLATLVDLRRRLGLPREAVLATGDGANDLAMLAEAGLGVAFHAKPAVAAAAHARLGHADLTGLLYLQGYAREAFVEAR